MAARLPSVCSLALLALLLAVAAALQAPTALAQETTGRLEGRVLDAKGKPIADVNVSVTSPALQGGQAAVTDGQGWFRLMALPVGSYRVELTHVAFQKQIIRELRVHLGQTTSLGDVRMQEQVYEQATVEVSARAPQIDPSSTEVGGTLVAKDYAALPVDRDYRSIATLMPQANQSYLGDPVNFAGATGIENRYFIDGIDVTDPVRGLPGTALPYNFVEEVEIRTGGYEAEYRSSLGGTVNAITYSGGNEVTSQVFGYYTNSQFVAPARRSYLGSNLGGFALYDVGFGIGGPVMKDRLWYFLAYNPSFRRQDVELSGWGYYPDKTTMHSFAGKLTWRANRENTLVLTAVGDPTERQGGGAGALGSFSYGQPGSVANPDPYLTSIHAGGVDLLLEGRHAVHDNLLFRTSMSLATTRDRNVPRTERGRTEELFNDWMTGTSSGGAADRCDNRTAVLTAGASSVWLTGDHEIKAGFEYKESRWDWDFTQKWIDHIADTQYVETYANSKARLDTRVPSAFLQDAWRLTERLRVNAGLRWDGQYIVASDGKVAQTIRDEWQPRVGFTWQPGDLGKQKIFGSAGRFYQELAVWSLWLWYNANTQTYAANFADDPRVDPAGGDTLRGAGGIQPRIHDLQGQHFDEVTLGYERQVGANARFGLRGVHRTLREALDDIFDPLAGLFAWGNPGRGQLSPVPRARRSYSALEITYQREAGDRLTVMASYVLSRTYGNYPGLFVVGAFPNAGQAFDLLEQVPNGEGLLPSDRTNVFKLSGRCRLGAGVTLGAVGLWESGTPLSVLGAARNGPAWSTFLSQRGTAGRTPGIWDLNVRIGYAPFIGSKGRWQPRVTADLLHVLSRREAVGYEQKRYLAVDDAGNQITLNPAYGLPIQFQPPMAVRVGAEMQF